VAGLVFAMLYYMASLLFGLAIAQSVVEEKQSRVVEILATAIPVRQLLIGKIVGNTLLALGQMLLFVGAGLVGVTFTSYKQYLSTLTGPAAWYLVFFLAGFIALACIWAVAGSLASRSEDLQSTTMPLTMVIVVALFVGISASGVWQVVTSYVPVISTITMPMRLLDNTASWWEAGISLLLTLAFAGVTVLLGEKLYRRSVMQTGGRVTLKQAMSSEID
jgi:ABC-2 type transport system permease protein